MNERGCGAFEIERDNLCSGVLDVEWAKDCVVVRTTKKLKNTVFQRTSKLTSCIWMDEVVVRAT